MPDMTLGQMYDRLDELLQQYDADTLVHFECEGQLGTVESVDINSHSGRIIINNHYFPEEDR